MSYCRFGPNSDVYAFCYEGEGFVVQVARNRTPDLDDKQSDTMSVSQMWQWLQENAQPIGGRCDGEEFILATPVDLVEKLRDLMALGYRVEPSTWANIEREHPGASLGLARLSGRAPQVH